MTPIPSFVVFLGALGLLAYWLAGRQATMVPSPDQADNWATPLYLRFNTPVFDGSRAIMPLVPSDPWSIATYTAEL